MNSSDSDTSSFHRLARGFAQTFRSLRSRNFKLYFIGQLISNSGNWLGSVALILLVLKITGSGFATGVLTACQFGPVVLLSAWGGAIADRVDKRRMLFTTQFLSMIQSFALAAMAFMKHPPLTGLYALAIAGGVLLAFDNPLRRSFVTEMVPEEDISNAVVLYSAIINISRIFGPALAGLLIVTLGYGWCFTIDASSYIAVLFCIWMMRPSELYRQTVSVKKERLKSEIKAGVRYTMATPSLWIGLVMFAIVQMLAYNFNVTLPLFVTDTLHSTAGVFTVLYSVFGIGAVICAFIVARRSMVRMHHIIIGAVALGISMLLLSAVPGVLFAVPAVFLVGMGSILYLTAANAIVQIEAQSDMHGRVISLQTVVAGGATLVGAPLLGWIADTMGGRMPIFIGGLASLVAAAFGYFALKRYGA